MTADWIITQLTIPLRTTVQDGYVTNLLFIFLFFSKAPQKATCKEAKVLRTNSKYKNVLSFNLQSLTLSCRLWHQLDKRLLVVVGTLQSEDAMAANTSLKRWIYVLAVLSRLFLPIYFIEVSRRTLLEMNRYDPLPSSERNKISSSLVFVLHEMSN